MKGIIRQNKVCLEQGLVLLEQITPELYRAQHANAYGSTLGDHFRHVIEFYITLFEGLESGLIDYGSRRRDPEISGDLDAARRELRGQIRDLESIGDRQDRAVRVASEDPEAPPSASSVARELNFLLSHTVHHFALIAFICRSAHIALPEHFGVAPSTLRYQESLED